MNNFFSNRRKTVHHLKIDPQYHRKKWHTCWKLCGVKYCPTWRFSTLRWQIIIIYLFSKESGKSWWLLIIFVIYIINLRIFFWFHRIKFTFNLNSTKTVLYKISLIRILCQGLINEPMILLTYQSYSSKSDQLRPYDWRASMKWVPGKEFASFTGG